MHPPFPPPQKKKNKSGESFRRGIDDGNAQERYPRKGFSAGEEDKAHPETVPCYYPVQALVFSALP